MKRLLTIVLLLLLAGPGFGTEQKTAPGKEPPSTPPPKKTQEKPVVTEQKPVLWPRPYQPSEEISADSAVPFPTDI